MSNYTTGFRRIELVGREEYIEKHFIKPFWASRRTQKPRLVLMAGPGGIGKTALVTSVLEKLRKKAGRSFRSPVIPSEVIDLYHIEYHTPLLLAQQIAQVLGEAGLNVSGFDKAVRDVQAAYQTHSYQAARERWEKAVTSLVKAINAAARENDRPVLLAFDTVETLDAKMPEMLASEYDPLLAADIGKWLLEDFLPRLEGRVMVIMAGRSLRFLENYRKTLKESQWQLSAVPEIPPLEGESAKQYLRAVAKTLRDQTARARIEQFLKTTTLKQIIVMTGGMPLHLALLADILQSGGSLPEPEQWRDKDGQMALLANRFLNLPADIGEILQAMATLRRGANAEIISRLTGRNVEDSQRLLEKTEALVLVKKRSSANVQHPYFLHDEIYRLSEQHIERSPKRRADEHRQIHAYYADLIATTRRTLQHAQPYRQAAYRSKLWQFRVEAVHYALRGNPANGYAAYFITASEAIEQRAPFAYALTHNELQRTLTDLKTQADPEAMQTLQAYTQADQQLRSAERAMLVEGNLETAEKRLASIAKQSLKSFSQSHLELDKGILYIKQRAYDKARESLEQASAIREKASQAEADEWQSAYQALHALILNYQGYLARLQGMYDQAVTFYRQAAAIMRKIHWDGMLSGVLTNLAYVMGVLGWERTAPRVAQEAMDAARTNGNLYDEIRALNVSAILNSRHGFPQRGYKQGQKAYQMLKELTVGNKPLQGFVQINLARALRYQWNEYVLDAATPDAKWKRYLPEGLQWLEKPETMEKCGIPIDARSARKDITPARAIFSLGSEPRAEADNEAGCLWREVAWVGRKTGEQDLLEHAYKIAETRFLEAAGIETPQENWAEQTAQQIKALGDNPFWPALALVNLGWLYLYSEDPTEQSKRRHHERSIKRILNIMCDLLPAAYKWQGAKPPEFKTKPNRLIWAVLGKAEMLRAYLALRNRHRADDEEKREKTLEEAVYHAALSLQYNRLIGSDNYDLRRAEDGLEHRIRLSDDWANDLLPAFYKYALQIKQARQIELPGEDKLAGKQLALLKFLEERFGEPELWGIDKGQGDATQ